MIMPGGHLHPYCRLLVEINGQINGTCLHLDSSRFILWLSKALRCDLVLFVAFSFLLFASVYGYLFVCSGALFSLCLCGPRAFCSYHLVLFWSIVTLCHRSKCSLVLNPLRPFAHPPASPHARWEHVNKGGWSRERSHSLCIFI